MGLRSGENCLSRIQSLRLAQFWQIRIKPLLAQAEGKGPVGSEEVLECVGWLAQGVFCGFFDPHEADVTWIRLRPLVEISLERFGSTGDGQVEEIVSLRNSTDPFRQSIQMVDGRQKAFELPFFSHALMLSNFLFSDDLARSCTSLLVGDQALWSEWERTHKAPDPSFVLDRA